MESSKTIKYVIEYRTEVSKRFEDEVIKKLDEFIDEELSGWPSVQYKKEWEQNRWYD